MSRAWVTVQGRTLTLPDPPAARAEEDIGVLDQDTAPKELFYTEGAEELRAARLQVAASRSPAHSSSPRGRALNGRFRCAALT
jgi:hypothetical protein